MIVADKNFLKATLSRGWIVTQSKLIQLYTKVLQSTGTQAAFVAGCAFMGIAELRMPKSGAGWWTGQNFLYDFFIHGALCLGVFTTTQAALVMVYGPAISLRGEDGDCVLLVATELRQQIMKILLIGALAIACLFFALMANYWAKIPIDLAATTMVFFLFGIAVTISEGIRVYNIFHPGSEFSLSNLLRGETKKEDDRQVKYQRVLSGAYDDLPTGGSGGGGGGGGSVSPSGVRSIVKASGSDAQSENSGELDPDLIALIEERKRLQKDVNTQARGVLWWRQPLEEGGQLICRFGVLDRGKLDLYASEDEFRVNANPLNLKPFKLSQYKLVTDYRYFPSQMTSGMMTLRSMVSGQGEIGFLELATSEYDLKEAVKKYRFALLPKVFSELSPLPSAEFMAGDAEEYRLWIKALQRVIKALETLESLSSDRLADLALSGNVSVEDVVQAANRS